MLDLVLAIVHHILIFAIFGILFAEFMALRPGMSNATAVRIMLPRAGPTIRTTGSSGQK